MPPTLLPPRQPPKHHLPLAEEIQRLLAAVDRGLADAAAGTISEETRFDAALKAVMQCAVVAMLMAGQQPAPAGTNHPLEMLDALSRILGIGVQDWAELNELRRRRTAGDYNGRPIEPDATAHCLAQAVALRRRLHARLAAEHPELLSPP